MTDHMLRENRNRIISVTLNRPDKLNAMTPDMLDTIRSAIADLRDKDEYRVMVIRGRGDYFSAGMDISAGLAPEGRSGVEFRNWYRRTLHTLFDEIEAVEKPVVVAAQGPCLGGALEMSLSCDFRLAAASATYSLPETNLGVIPGSGGTSRLTHLVGTGWAKWMIMAAQTVDANQALQMGLVHAVYADDKFDDQVNIFCTHLASLPKETVGLAKLAIGTIRNMDPSSARNVERIANSWLTMSDEHKSLMEKFLSKKK